MSSPFALFRPFLWVAALAFITGFSACLLLSAGSLRSGGHVAPHTLQASAGQPG
jgi:hypothetical protein